MTERILIFGGSGDLTGRYLLPALAHLDGAGHLPPGLPVVGVGRHEWADEQYRDFAGQWLRRRAGHLTGAAREQFARRLKWRRLDVTDAAQLRHLFADDPAPAVVYLALPPAVYAPVVGALAEAGLPPGSKLVVEKPFGTDLASARDLNRGIARLLPEESVFRVDHFLAHQTVQNIIGLRFGNRLFEPLWNQAHVAQVDIVWDETLALEGRAAYYDRTGALRDMLQNHLLQLLTLIAMEPPAGVTERDLRDRKVEVLRATRPLSTGGGPATVRARYTAGAVQGRQLPAYVDEQGVAPDRQTESYAEIILGVDNWRWAGVPFRLRSGKALASDRHEIVVRFRPVPHSAFPAGEPLRGNTVRFSVDPDQISLDINLNADGDLLAMAPAELTAVLAPQGMPAYARLLLDILHGDPTLSTRGDEAEEAWRIVGPILASWERGEVPLLDYPAGSTGPQVHR